MVLVAKPLDEQSEILCSHVNQVHFTHILPPFQIHMVLCYFTYPVSHATRNSSFRCNNRSFPNGCLELECPFSKPNIIVCACQRDCLQTVMPLCHTLVQSQPIPPICHSGRALVGHWVCYIYLRRHCGWIGTGGTLSRKHVRGIHVAIVVKCFSLPALICPLVISYLNRNTVE